MLKMTLPWRTPLMLMLLLTACTGRDARLEGSQRVSHPGKAPTPSLDTFFALPSYQAPQLSPDGRWIAWLSPVEGVSNFFVAPIADIHAKRQLTFRRVQGVRPYDVSGVVMYRWSADSRFILYPHDQQGNEHWNLWRVDVERGGEINLTPDPSKSHSILEVSSRYPERIGISAGTFGQHDFATYTLNLQTAALELVEPSDPSVLHVFLDAEFQPRARVSLRPDRTIALERRQKKEWSAFRVISKEDRNEVSAADFQKIARLSTDGSRLYTYNSANRDTNALVSYDLDSGRVTTIAQDDRVDLGGVLFDPRDNRPIAYVANWIRSQWHAIDSSIAADLGKLASRYPAADYQIVSVSADNRRWIVEYSFPDAPEVYELYNRDSGVADMLATSTPELKQTHLSRVYSTLIQSSDGLPLISYYSLPVAFDPHSTGIPDKPLPMVMVVHGGPSDERATYGSSFSVSNGFVQWMASRGYIVYNMNYRGSAGFGKRYTNAANGEWGGKMHTDLLEQMDELVRRRIADPSRVAILGGSYGGYATLVGMTMTPGVFACGVDLVGPSSLEVPMPHWDPAEMAIFLGGDPRTEQGREFLRSRSPLAHADKTRGAVLIGQGSNDSRVPQKQSDQMVDIMQGVGAKVVYAVFPDEGHGFRRRENRLAFWGITDIFLSQCLGGPSEPIGDKLIGSSIRIPAGAALIPGLTAALSAPAAAKH